MDEEGGLPLWVKAICIAALVLTVIGTIQGLIFGGFLQMWKTGASGNWARWQYALAVPAIGGVYVVAEWVGELLGAPLGWGGPDQPAGKRAMH